MYNHILASQNPETGMMCYYVPLRSGSRKVYNSALDDFWCCTGTGIENHAKYGDSIYFHDGAKTLYVNLFIASELSWQAKGVTVRQETGYPLEQSTRLVLACRQPTELVMKIRHPAWAESGFAVRVNGQVQASVSRAGTFEEVSRLWQSGDTIEISLPFGLRTEGFRDNPNRRAFLHGPLVLAAEIDARGPIPAIVADAAGAISSLKPLAGRPSTFTGSPSVFRQAGKAAELNLTLKPFYKVHGARHYVVYWDLYTPSEWQAKEAEHAAGLARRKALEERTVDLVTPGEEPNEKRAPARGREYPHRRLRRPKVARCRRRLVPLCRDGSPRSGSGTERDVLGQ